jgi:DHA1 family tetracycline resistance protein-like MFS transporter
MTKDLNRRLAIVIGYVFIDLLGFSLILPLLPYLAETFQATPLVIGLLPVAKALPQMLSTPIIGRLSDRFGRKPLLLMCIASTVIGFVLLATARSLTMLFVSRIVDGLLGGNTALARTYITDITDDKNRSRGLGLIGAAFGVGFIIGPLSGGLLSKLGYSVPGFVAAALSLANFIAVALWLPESLTPQQRKVYRSSPHTAFNLQRLVEAIKRPCVGPLLQVRFWFSLAFTLFQVNFVLYAKIRLGLDLTTTSLLLTFVGVLAVITQVFIIGHLTDRFSEKTLIRIGTIILAFSLVGWGLVPNLFLLVIVLVPIAVAGGVLSVVITSQLTKAIRKEEVGGTLGLDDSLQTFAQIVTPVAGGALIQYLGASSLGFVAGALMAIAVLVVQLVLMGKPELHGPCSAEDAKT